MAYCHRRFAAVLFSEHPPAILYLQSTRPRIKGIIGRLSTKSWYDSTGTQLLTKIIQPRRIPNTLFPKFDVRLLKLTFIAVTYSSASSNNRIYRVYSVGSVLSRRHNVRHRFLNNATSGAMAVYLWLLVGRLAALRHTYWNQHASTVRSADATKDVLQRQQLDDANVASLSATTHAHAHESRTVHFTKSSRL